MQLTAIYIYPVKSLGSIALQEAVAETRGLARDRRWMLTDADGVFLSQRELPEMALLQPEITEDQLIIRHRRKAITPLAIPLDVAQYGAACTVSVWKSTCQALRVGQQADEWFTATLGVPCQLVYMPEDSIRPINPDYARPGDRVSFADGYPFLIVGEAAMDFLNSKLPEPMDILRFRPNFVFSGQAPHEEDNWRRFSIGSIQFRGTKPCARCPIPTIDPQTAVQGKEPTKTLATYRRSGNNVNFGLNACLDGPSGIVRVGEQLQVLQTGL